MKNKGCFGKLFSVFWIGYFGFMILGFIGGIIDSALDDSIGNIKADGFTIEAYNVDLDVHEDGKVNVNEDVTVNWDSTNHHGIYKFTPEWLEYTGKDGKTIKRKSIVKDMKSSTDVYTNDYIKKKARIRLGSADEYVDLGLRTYNINYTYDMGSDPFKGFDEFIFHTFGDYWGTEIKNPKITIHMPKSIENKKVNFFTDKYRKENVNDYVNYSINDKTMVISFDEEKYKKDQYEEYCSYSFHQTESGKCDDFFFKYNSKSLESSLTVDIELPDNYFSSGSWNYGIFSFLIILIIFGLTIYVFFMWKKYGKDLPKRAKTIEFYAPDGLSSAEVGYIYKKRNTKKLVVSLIIALASKGYIKINDLGKDIEVVNLYAKPAKLPKFEKLIPKREIVIDKLRNEDDSLSKDAIAMMKYLFKNGNTKKLSSNLTKFDKVSLELSDNGYIKIVSDNKDSRYDDVDTLEKEYQLKEEQYNKDYNDYLKRIGKLKQLNDYEQIVYDRLFESKDTIIISEHKTLYLTFNEIDKSLKQSFKDLVVDKVASKKMIKTIVISIIVAVLSVVSYRYIEDLDPRFNYLYYISFGCILINLFFSLIMKRKTEYGEEIIAKIEGFRDFLNTVEKEKLDSLVLENPCYFYDILPYTYVLDISKKWISKFEKISFPERDMGDIDFNNDSRLYSMTDYYTPTPTFSGGSSSGCSSCGGGCSSCGGGCSSCGGGGSW